MGDNQRQVVRNEETLIVGDPEQTTVDRSATTVGNNAGMVAPVANQSTVQSTTTTARPGDQVVAHNYAESVIDPAAEKAASVDWLGRTVWFLVGLMSVLLIIRFILLAAGANETVGFAQLIYGLTGWVVAPFAGLFGRPITFPGSASTSVIEFESIVAIVVLVLIGWLVTKLAQLALGTNRTTGTTYTDTDRKTRV